MLILIFVGVALLMLLVGWLAGRGEGVEDFNIYGRRLPAWLYSVTYAATYMGAGFFIAGTAYAYRYGFSYLWVLPGLALGILIFGHFSSWLRKSSAKWKPYNLPGYYRARFGPKAGLALTIILLLLTASDLAIQLISGGKLLEELGVAPLMAGILLTVVVIGTYLMMSGFRAVVWTDVILLSFILVLTVSLAAVSSVAILRDPGPVSFGTMPLATVLGFFLYGIFGVFGSAPALQRIFAGKDGATARKGTWLSFLWILLPLLCLGLIALAARQSSADLDPDLAFFRALALTGTFGVYAGSVLLWAALMSTADTHAFVGGQIVCQDLLHRKLDLRNVRLGLVAILLTGTLMSILLPSVIHIGMLFIGLSMAIAVPTILHWLVDLSERAVVLSLIVASAGAVAYCLLVAFDPAVVVVSIALSVSTLFLVKGAEMLARPKTT